RDSHAGALGQDPPHADHPEPVLGRDDDGPPAGAQVGGPRTHQFGDGGGVTRGYVLDGLAAVADEAEPLPEVRGGDDGVEGRLQLLGCGAPLDPVAHESGGLVDRVADWHSEPRWAGEWSRK